MGIIGNVAMPFLSTLAALVIIVHSTEDAESGYRRDLRPRVLDTGTPNYDQPWRVVDQKSIIEESTQGDSWNNNSPEEPPKRRRPGRKRKRRPQSSFSEYQIPQDRYGYPEEPLRPYFEVETPEARQTTETGKRRRKPESKRIDWTQGPLELERPFRRRNQRRKRPSLAATPELSEFNGYQHYETPKKAVSETTLQENNDDNYRENSNTQNENEELTEQNPLPEEKEFEFIINKPELQEDKSLSEFSIEVMTQAHEPSVEDDSTVLQTKLGDKVSGVLSEHDKSKDKSAVRGYGHKCVSDFISPPKPYPDIKVNYESLKYNMMREKALEKAEQSSTIKIIFHRRPSILYKCRDKLQTRSTENGPIDPLSLKDILKRSNGSSLSEILQQHNLSLADLLHGKENAISILKSKNPFEYRKGTAKTFGESDKTVEEIHMKESNTGYRDGSHESVTNEKQLPYSIANQSIDLIPQNTNVELSSIIQQSKVIKKEENLEITTTTEKQETVTPKIISRIRFPTGLRKKLHMRPMMNTTYKAQLSRDLVALNARKYIHHRRNNTKLKQWQNMLPSLTNKTTDQAEKKQVSDTGTENYVNEETTTVENKDIPNVNRTAQLHDARLKAEVTTQAYTTTKVVVKEIFTNISEDQSTPPPLKQPDEIFDNRKQPFNNRKKKRIRQKSSTTESPQESIIQSFFGMNDYPSIDVILKPNIQEINEESEVFPTNLEDFVTSASVQQTNYTKPSESSRKSTTTILPMTQRTKEETAKFEIDEILNDTRASARLSKVLMERNMTLSELVEHRERGSSHIHLADIFHNASKEPNPPEPFLSKSLIEPISKETYPLRAILEANLHDASVKATTNDPTLVESNYMNIPVVLDFGNNVNENAENMGIMSLFSNFTRFNVVANNKQDATTHPTVLAHKPEVITEITQMISNTTNLRESRVLSDVVKNDNKDDVASWQAIFSLMRQNYKNESKDFLENFTEELHRSNGVQRITLENDNDGDGLIVLEDLQHLTEFDNNIAPVPDERLELNSMERGEATSGILEIIPSQTKSVTVATASIAGLAIVLFLLTYAAFKWKQQREISANKHNFTERRLPTPVFENRKCHKNNNSSRSISPMLSTSNIYTLNTLDSRNGKESPEYMWDTLRKPFQ